MKRKNIFTASSILVLIMVLLMSTAQAAFAATTDKWETMSPMSSNRGSFQTEVINGKIYAIGGFNGSNYVRSVEEYDPTMNKWTTKASMSATRGYHETEVLDGKIYVMGGSEGKAVFSSIEEYDPTMDKWTTKASMSVPRMNFQTEILNGKIYVIGGDSDNYGNTLSSVEEYDPSSNTWTTKASMSVPRRSFQTKVLNGKIYAMGGDLKSDGTLTSSVEEYDPSSNTWTTKASMSIPRESFQTKVLNGKIYAIGGANLTSTVEEYDPSSNTWTTKASMSATRTSFRTENLNGRIYAIGGSNTATLSSIEEYNPIANVWTTKTPMSVPRGYLQTEVIDGKIYAIGGLILGKPNIYNSSVEKYTPEQSDPTLTLTASSKKVKVGQQFTTSVDIHNGTNICAEDIVINYDKDLFTYAGAEAQTGLKIYKEDTSVPGTVRFISACQGKENAATGDKGLITLKFTAKKEGTGKVDIIKGRIADNATLEMDVAEANCGEDTITVEGYGDVNKTGEFTLLDLGIDGWYHGMNAADTDTAKFNVDVVADGKIDDNDLAEITKGILANSNYPFDS